MRRNEGTADRVVRAVLGAGALAAAFALLGAASGAVGGIVAAIVGVVLLLTAVVGFCPAYKLVGLSTCPVNKRG
jgi:hypothetical protein